jgi:signal transduction histidine kinase/integral membrane sensor domain MASE1/ActR/RegA family two-component response regulator
VHSRSVGNPFDASGIVLNSGLSKARGSWMRIEIMSNGFLEQKSKVPNDSRRRLMLDILLLAVLYALVSIIGWRLVFPQTSTVIVFPAPGMALAFLLLRGANRWPGLLLGVFMAAAIGGTPPVLWFGLLLADTLPLGLCAWYLIQFCAIPLRSPGLAGSCRIIGIGGVLSAVSSATLGTCTYCLAGLFPWSDAGQLWYDWLSSNVLGTMLVTPLLLAWAIGPNYRVSSREVILAILASGLLVGIGAQVFVGWSDPHSTLNAWAFALFPIVLWFAVRFQVRGSATACMIVAVLAILGMIFQGHAFVEENAVERIRFLRAFLGTLSLAGGLCAVSITERRAVESEQREQLNRKRKHQAALVKLAVLPSLGEGDFDKTVQVVTEKLADNLEVARASVWLFSQDANQLRCADLFEITKHHHSNGACLAAKDYPAYFRYLQENLTIAANDAQSDPATREFAEGYLKPLGIKAMLDTCIRRSGRLFGVICCEHVEGLRKWSDDDIAFCGAVADQVMHAFYNRERRHSEEALVAARESAEAANRAKSHFLATMSHEIRTPMNGIMLTSQILLASQLTGEQKEFVQVVDQSAHALLKVINDILDISKIEAGKMTLDSVEFSLPQLVDRTKQLLKIQAAQKGLELFFQVDAALPRQLRGDSVRLGQILVNLVGNAIKYTDRGSIRIDVTKMEPQPNPGPVPGAGHQSRVLLALPAGSATTEPPQPETSMPASVERVWIQIAVSDTGIGIAADKIHSIFDAFTQVDNSFKRTHGGTGLGLAITKKLLDMMGGRITVTSRPGEGSVFSAEIPLDPAAERRHTSAKSTATADLAGEEDRFDGLRLLLVDDSPVNLRIVKFLLVKHGCLVEMASNGREALSLIERQPFDMVLMDVQMPVMDGHEATAALRARERSACGRVPVIAMTANAIKGDRELCLDHGMDDYITKPIQPSELFAALRRNIPACPMPII